MRILMLLLLLASCGDSKVKIEEPDKPLTIDGDTYSYIVVQLEFIKDVRQLCEDVNLRSDFESEELYNKEVAQCTIDNLSLIDLGAIDQFNNDICNDPQTEDEIAICNAIN